ncbi:protein of unknown function [Candidatus Filomicrobium marinum]|uniref:Uncharacterized protein n=1 Tax=Candidatus Filomicrobium marinum TaxID=1608628 RepID=A0A0D6JDC0_9HYPH|nr:protein of unknown function [Candidatus Filomicrobium marinum]CPR17761.1 protein of unknown function [Candidatus Filomicrobium marinum]
MFLSGRKIVRFADASFLKRQMIWTVVYVSPVPDRPFIRDRRDKMPGIGGRERATADNLKGRVSCSRRASSRRIAKCA